MTQCKRKQLFDTKYAVFSLRRNEDAVFQKNLLDDWKSGLKDDINNIDIYENEKFE